MDKDTITIVFGDSLVYGLHDYEFGGWVNRLRIKLNNKDKSNFVFNMGIPGENSSNILLRLEDEIKNRYNEEDNFKFIFCMGIKDSILLNDDSLGAKWYNINDLSKEKLSNIAIMELKKLGY